MYMNNNTQMPICILFDRIGEANFNKGMDLFVNALHRSTQCI